MVFYQPYNMKTIIAFATLLVVISSQKCLSHSGQEVDWYLQLHLPKTVSNGYLYFDSLSSQPHFQHFDASPDSPDQPLSNTLNQINTLPNTDYLAWNDQNPNGSTTSVRAHSKHVLLFHKDTQDGVVIVHSMPKYPAIVDHQVQITIPDGQRIYGQHFFCLAVKGTTMEQLIAKATTTRLYVYASSIPEPQEILSEYLLNTQEFTVGSTDVKAVFKNGRVNGSIFENGLSAFFQSEMLAETWGRPSQYPWCGNDENPFSVGNVVFLRHESGLEWKTTQDHSKWAVTLRQGVDWSCIGDMNRMASQWKRGGTFYCLKSQPLRQALKNLILIQEVCSK